MCGKLQFVDGAVQMDCAALSEKWTALAAAALWRRLDRSLKVDRFDCEAKAAAQVSPERSVAGCRRSPYKRHGQLPLNRLEFGADCGIVLPGL